MQNLDIPFDVKHLHIPHPVPTKDYLFWMKDAEYQELLDEETLRKNDLLVLNTVVHFDSCGCDFICQCEPWPDEITFKNDEGLPLDSDEFQILFCDEGMQFTGPKGYLHLNDITDMTMREFVNICTVVGIELKLKD